MLEQLTRNLKSQHLLILITLVIIAIFFTAMHDHLETSTSELHRLNIPVPDASSSDQSTADLPAVTTTDNSATELNTTNKITSASTQATPKPMAPKMGWQTVTVRPGDTSAKIFARLGLDYADLEKIIHLPAAKTPLTQLKPEQNLHFKLGAQQQLEQVKFAYNDLSTLYIKRRADKFIASISNKALQTRLVFKEFTVHHSVISSALNSGLTSTLYSQIQSIFKSSINFAKSVRAGDHFEVLYQEYYLNGRKYKPGNVMVANFNGQQQQLTAVRYTDPAGNSSYYTPKGNSLQTSQFLAAPLHYTRISSYFSLNRLDPYLHKYHPHLGVDYAAPAGTPIHSVGDGVVTFRGWDNGYGNAVIVKYDGIYKGLYGHMSRFAANLRVGEHVNKGQVIGYVGSTGWATGDHLHFGWYVNDIPRDPLKYKATPLPVPNQYRNSFLAEAKNLLNQLQMSKDTEFAENKTDDTTNRS